MTKALSPIQWVKQPKNCCGQACLAMLAGVPVEEVIEIMGKRGLTRTKDIVNTLELLGFKPKAAALVRLKMHEVIPDNCILKLNFYRAGKRLNKSHWILKWDGRFYDPEREQFQMPTNGYFTSYLPIEEEE